MPKKLKKELVKLREKNKRSGFFFLSFSEMLEIQRVIMLVDEGLVRKKEPEKFQMKMF